MSKYQGFVNQGFKWLGDAAAKGRMRHLPSELQTYCYTCEARTMHSLEDFEEYCLRKGPGKVGKGWFAFAAATKFLPGAKLGMAIGTDKPRMYVCSRCDNLSQNKGLYEPHLLE